MKAVLTVEHDPRLLRAFQSEDKDIERGSYTIAEDDGNIVFTITADDAVGMRILFNNITKLISLWERTADL